jgi:hypothetical protein
MNFCVENLKQKIQKLIDVNQEPFEDEDKN